MTEFLLKRQQKPLLNRQQRNIKIYNSFAGLKETKKQHHLRCCFFMTLLYSKAAFQAPAANQL
jgi:hypothetical protein